MRCMGLGPWALGCSNCFNVGCDNCKLVYGAMEFEDFSSSSGGMSDGETDCLEDDKDEELVYATDSLKKLQPRKVKCKTCWNDVTRMAELIEQKGRMHITMGIVRGGKIYFSIAEILFLAEQGGLILLDNNNTSLPLRYTHRKVMDGKNGCSWEAFEVYRHLKSLGFIVGRHGVPWSLKGMRGCSVSLESPVENSERIEDVSKENSILEQLKDLQIEDLRPIFDVYLPNSKFRKSSPGNPASRVYLTGANPPSIATVQNTERRSDGIPMRFGHVDHGRVSFFTFGKVELPILP